MFFISTRTKWSFFQTIIIVAVVLFASHNSWAQSVRLYTPYTKISVPPGESIDYSVDIINNSNSIRDVGISLSGLPKDWDYSIKSGGWTVERMAVLPGEKKTFKLQVEVPLKIEKGNHYFKVVAPGYDQLPLTVVVSEQGTFKTEFTSDQPNMEGHASSSFSFNAELKNQTAEAQLYSLRARPPRGWQVAFKANRKQATSVKIDPNDSKSISIDVNPPASIEAGTYKIPVRAVTSSTAADLELEVVITGSYEMELTTPSGLLSAKVTAGGDKKIELVVKNTGSSELRDVELKASKPAKWEVSFEPQKIASIQPGKTATAYATIQAYDKAIAGDYVTNMEAKTPEVSSKAAFRISVRSSLLTGWLGILIIIAVFGGVFYLFRKYGRR